MSHQSARRFSRDELIFGLNEVLRALRAAPEPASIRIVGGAAISLRYSAGRGATKDLDAELGPANVILGAAGRVAREQGWPTDWLNDDARIFLPNGFGVRSAEWDPIYDRDGITVEIASAETLLAMKLNAAASRGRRDLDDIAVLLNVCDVTSADQAEELFESFYPGEGFNELAARMVDVALSMEIDVDHPPGLDFPAE